MTAASSPPDSADLMRQRTAATSTLLRAIGAVSIVGVLLTAVGCAQQSRAGVQSGTVTITPPDDAGTVTVRVEIVSTTRTQEKGLSGRTEVPTGTGMWFPLGHGRAEGVWMAGMKISIDIAWVKDSKIVQIRTLAPCTARDQSRCPKWYSPGIPDALLETAAGGLAGTPLGSAVTITRIQPTPSSRPAAR